MPTPEEEWLAAKPQTTEPQVTEPQTAEPQATEPQVEEPRRDDDLAARVRDLENALAAARAVTPLGLVPAHGGGPGTDVNETWSQAEQEAAIADERA